MNILMRRRTLVCVDGKYRCYNGAYEGWELRWGAWEVVDSCSPEFLEARLSYWRDLNAYAVSQRGDSARCEFKTEEPSPQPTQRLACRPPRLTPRRAPVQSMHEFVNGPFVAGALPDRAPRATQSPAPAPEDELASADARSITDQSAVAPVVLTVDALAQEIRLVDGAHSLSASALADALMPFFAASQRKQP